MLGIVELLESDLVVGSVQSFARFAQRNKQAQEYASLWEQAYLQHGITDELRSHARHMKLMEVSMKTGLWSKAMLSQLLLNMRHLALSESTPEEEASSHEDFVKKFEKKFGLKVERFENIGNGVALFLDGESTSVLQAKLRKADDFEEIIDSLDYICTRRGQINDINFGSFSEKLSKWVFIHSPKVEIKGKKFEPSILKQGKRQPLSSLTDKDFE